MPEQPNPLCNVVDCSQPAAGSYLRAAGARSLQFAVCQQHLAELRAGALPTVVAERFDLAQLDGSHALLLNDSNQRRVIINCRAARAAVDTLVAREVTTILERRAAMTNPPLSLTVSDAVALGIAAHFRSTTATGQVMDYFVRTGSIDSRELIQAAQFEQGYASPEGHAALYCLIGWARGRAHREAEHLGAR